MQILDPIKFLTISSDLFNMDALGFLPNLHIDNMIIEKLLPNNPILL